MKKNNLAKVFVYKKTRTTMEKLKEGDIFSLEGGDHSSWAVYLATSFPRRDSRQPRKRWRYEITAVHFGKFK